MIIHNSNTKPEDAGQRQSMRGKTDTAAQEGGGSPSPLWGKFYFAVVRTIGVLPLPSMKHVPVILNLIQAALLVVLVVVAIHISRQLPARPAPTLQEYQKARTPQARREMESQVPMVAVNNWPDTYDVEVNNWPGSFDVDVTNWPDQLPVYIDGQNGPISVMVDR